MRELYNLKRFGFRVFNLSNEGLEHIEHGNVRVQIVNGQKPKLLPDKSPNPEFIVDDYTYLPGNGKSAPMAPLQARHKAVGGLHMLRTFADKTVRVSKVIRGYILKTGEGGIVAEIEFWVEELGKWVRKKDPSTMFPKGWDMQKIQEKILEATENIKSYKGRFFRGVTKDGIEIEIIVDGTGDIRQIETAYIYIEK